MKKRCLCQDRIVVRASSAAPEFPRIGNCNYDTGNSWKVQYALNNLLSNTLLIHSSKVVTIAFLQVLCRVTSTVCLQYTCYNPKKQGTGDSLTLVINH